MPAPNDPRFDWIWTPDAGNEDQWIRGRCNHLTPIPVHAQPTGELVAHLCPDCDAQLPAEWSPIRSSIRVTAAPAAVKSSPYFGGPEFGSGVIASPAPFLLEPGERVLRPRSWRQQ